jgi:hypothetical protein
MAINPKLEFFRFRLKPYKASDSKSFKMFLEEEGIIKKNSRTPFKTFFEHFVRKLTTAFDDKTNYKKIKIFKKSKLAVLNNIPAFHTEKNLIEGIIAGGTYGSERTHEDENSTEESEFLIKVGDTIYQPFYFFLYTPLEHNEGFIIVQSYATDTVTTTVRKFIEKLFVGKKYYQAQVSPWWPDEFIQENKKGAEIKSAIFNKTIVQTHLATKALEDYEKEFNVKIIVTPRNGNTPISKAKEVIQYFKQFLFKTPFSDVGLAEFGDPQLSVTTTINPTPKLWEWNQKDNEILPTIYLENRISINEDGIPDYDELKEFCLGLFDKLKLEFRKDFSVKDGNQ